MAEYGWHGNPASTRYLLRSYPISTSIAGSLSSSQASTSISRSYTVTTMNPKGNLCGRHFNAYPYLLRGPSAYLGISMPSFPKMTVLEATQFRTMISKRCPTSWRIARFSKCLVPVLFSHGQTKLFGTGSTEFLSTSCGTRLSTTR